MSTVALIADVIASRRRGAGPELFEELLPQLKWIDGQTRWEQPLTFTVGDEVQAVYPSLAQAIRASLLLQTMPGQTRLRVGIGAGSIVQTRASQQPYGQTGEAWWRARDALEHVEWSETPKRLRTSRTWISTDNEEIDAALNVSLTLRDHLLSRMDDTDRVIVRHAMAGLPQTEIAKATSLNPASVSRRITRNGIRQVVWTQERIEDQFDE